MPWLWRAACTHNYGQCLNSARRNRDTETLGAIMISLADSKRIIPAVERKLELIGQPMNIAATDDGGDLVAHLRIDRRWSYGLIAACVALFAGSAAFGQQAQFQGSVPTG